jgi:succinyl-CoA synthetase alpha subunit
MGILVDHNTRVLVQGITGRDGSFHTARMLAYGTKVVAGVTPGKGGQVVEGVPVFNTVREAVAATGAQASVLFVGARFAQAALFEAIDNHLETVVCITEGIPVKDMLEVTRRLRDSRTRLIGPNCPGLTTLGETRLGIIPADMFTRGPVGIISRSGTLTYEMAAGLTAAGIGLTTILGIGGDPIIGTTFVDALKLFEDDIATRVVVLVGEIGGTDEEKAAEYIKHSRKPVAAFISGRSAPAGKRMGHAGAIISGGKGTAESKIATLTAAGAVVADTITATAEAVKNLLGKSGL